MGAVKNDNVLASLLALSFLVTACGATEGPASASGVAPAPASLPFEEPLDSVSKPRLKRTMDEVISTFENDDPILHYSYIENIHDGRGYTAGRAGFTTATCDLLEVVQRYLEVRSDIGFSTLVPLLKLNCADRGESVIGLETLPLVWKKAAKDPEFRKAQDDVSDELYYLPALASAKALGIQTPLGILCVYDTYIQHGADGFAAIAAKMNPALKDEKSRLLDFLNWRYDALIHPTEPGTDDAWAESVGRVSTLRNLIKQGRFNLETPFAINPNKDDEAIVIR
jgi:chitosanase